MKNQEEKETIIIYKIPEVYFPTFPAPKTGIIIPLDNQFHVVKDDETIISWRLVPNWYFNLWLDWSVATVAATDSLYKNEE